MPDYLTYRKSISDELLSIKDRVRHFIDDRNWGEDGRYKEVILRNVLARHLPDTASVGTGFVVGKRGRVSTQIDILVYSNAAPPLFKLDDFVVVATESVLGIIEVKTTIRNADFCEIMKKAHENGELISDRIFNGIFGYESELKCDDQPFNQCVKNGLESYTGYVNNISFGKDLFMKYWEKGSPLGEANSHYSFYSLCNLSFGYFISNLVEYVQVQLTGEQITDTLGAYLYPIEKTKEASRIKNYEIQLTDNQ
jgi:hypothetical protein